MASEAATRAAQPGRRLLVTLGALVVFQLGRQIPLAGLDLEVWRRFQQAGDGSLARISIFALGVTPIFSALILAESAAMASPALERRRDSSQSRAVVRLIALALAAFQGLGLAFAFETIPGLVDEPGATFRLEVVGALVGSTALAAWLADVITVWGVGDGFWLLLATPGLARLPGAAMAASEAWRRAGSAPQAVVIVGGSLAAAVALVILVAGARTAGTAPAADATGRACAGGRGGGIDIWPPLLANFASGWLISAVLLVIGGRLDDGVLAIGGPVHLALNAGLIAAFVSARGTGGNARRPLWPTALAQIAICAGAEVLSATLKLPADFTGAGLIVAPAIGADYVARFDPSRQTRSQPTPGEDGASAG